MEIQFGVNLYNREDALKTLSEFSYISACINSINRPSHVDLHDKSMRKNKQILRFLIMKMFIFQLARLIFRGKWVLQHISLGF